MGDADGLDKLLFELASESRLGILRELQAKNLKMQEAARRLDLTATDAFRQLQRLSEASLIRRQPDGSYSITEYGRLVLQSTSSLELLEKHKEYFLTHDLLSLPGQFVNRIGELSHAQPKHGFHRKHQSIRKDSPGSPAIFLGRRRGTTPKIGRPYGV